jgi:hypothetical protein
MPALPVKAIAARLYETFLADGGSVVCQLASSLPNRRRFNWERRHLAGFVNPAKKQKTRTV